MNDDTATAHYNGQPSGPTAQPPLSPPQLASISLPKGGGAIRSIGDSFTAHPVTGTGSMAVPVPVTPGRSGVQPQLTLEYQSGHGNGPFGIGWDVGLPTITRRTDRGLPRYVDDAESDTFLWSGAEDLVPVRTGNDNIDTTTDPDFFVYRYRPRIDNQHARIERWVRRTDPTDAHWRTMSPENMLTLYGLTAAERITDPADPQNIFSWLISQTRDVFGNAVLYTYKSEDAQGVDVSRAGEHHRGPADAVGRQVNRYLKDIRYANTTPLLDADGSRPRHLSAAQLAATDWHFQVVLDYGEHDPVHPTPAEQAPWTIRLDSFSSHRSGFEVRSHRLCRRIMMFHHFPEDADPAADGLVGSLTLTYNEEPIGSTLATATQHGHRRTAAQEYVSRATPPLEFTYTQAQMNETLGIIDDADTLTNLPIGVDGGIYRFADLDAEGLPGILTEQAGRWRYKPSRGGGRYEPGRDLPTLPTPATGGGATSLMDLSGSGQLDLVELSDAGSGFFRRTAHDGWEPQAVFHSLPELDWADPNLRFVDLDGDGLADILLTRDDAFTWYPSLGEDGFGAARMAATSCDETTGPRLVLADGTETVYLADMSGDGLSDLVRIRNHDIAYWPNLGYGRFGPKTTMENAPLLDRPDCFDGRRIRLADIDGSGTTDVIYLGADAAWVYRNQSGNSWSIPQLLGSFPRSDDVSTVTVADVLGNGTSCLVWSSALPTAGRSPLRYLDLMGGTKPHLLVGVVTNTGLETRVHYQPSTAFYLADKAAGQPWSTRLPFPVQLVESVETLDLVGRSRYTARYSYHHGYYDGVEREFGGFARIEQWDTEEHHADLTPAAEQLPDPFSVNSPALWQPPVRTRTWFHTGAPSDATVTRQLADEYWLPPQLTGDLYQTERAALELPDSALPAGLTADERREAFRALRGTPLRTETTAADGTIRADIPYETTEQRVEVRLVQPRGSNRHAILTTHPTESVHFHYERNPADPRITHDLNLEVDEYGNVLKRVTIGYGRTANTQPEPALPAGFQAALAHDQQRTHVSATVTAVTNPLTDPAATPDTHRTPHAGTVTTAELTGPPFISAAGSTAALHRIADIAAALAAAWTNQQAFEQLVAADVDGTGLPPDQLSARVTGRTVNCYRTDDLTALLPPGTLPPMAHPGESYRLALTDGLLTSTLGGRVTADVLTEGGYLQLAGETGWWVPSGRTYFSPVRTDSAAAELARARAHFFQQVRVVDLFGGMSTVTFDPYDLLPDAATDPVGNTTRAANDYRVMRADRTTDTNGNSAAVAFDCFGTVVGTAVFGKDGEGDSLAGFDPDLTDAVIAAALADPVGQAPALLGSATSRVFLDRRAYLRTARTAAPDPVAACTVTRETYGTQLAAGGQTRLLHALVYYDGLGREAQHKAQAEAGPVPGVVGTVPRWIGSGWTIYDNKGQPVRTYEPFFTTTPAFEFTPASAASVVVLRDSMGRAIGTVHPDHTYEKTVFDTWRQETWDTNDTVGVGDPRTDPDIGAAFTGFLGTARWMSWYDERREGTFGTTTDECVANQDAAVKSLAHANTPTVAHFDSLGRTCVTVLDNGTDGTGAAQRFATRTAQATDGKVLAVTNSSGHRVVQHCLRDNSGATPAYLSGYDLTGKSLYQVSSDGGERRVLGNAAGHPIRSWDARGHTFRLRYDPLQRLTHHYVVTAGTAERLIQRCIYGERHPDPARNLKGRLYRSYDSAGLACTEQFDFTGNPTNNYRQLAVHRNETPLPDWSAIDDITDNPAIDIAILDDVTAALLSPTDLYTTSATFDALNRPVQTVLPHRTGGPVSVVQPGYNDANLLSTVHIWLRRAGLPAASLDPATADIPAITAIHYNEHGQRLVINRGNNSTTSQTFDPATRRLQSITTSRPAADPSASTVQDLKYTYDAHGNITRVRDDADIHTVIFFRNQRVEPSSDYTYDPIYRLTRATGREHLGQTGAVLNPPSQPTNSDAPCTRTPDGRPLLSPSDGNAMGRYTETYQFDSVGNILEMAHQVAGNGWTRRYNFTEASRIDPTEMGERLTATSLPGDMADAYGATYTHDPHGNMTSMPHLPTMVWDELDRLTASSSQVVSAGIPETTHYDYEVGGERVRKATFTQSHQGTAPRLRAERIYLGAIEIYRTYDANGVVLERETVHGLLDHRTVVMAEIRTVDANGQDPGPERLIRYQYSSHISSSTLELDEESDLISYEEYFPYGSTAYQAVRSVTETPKRYRFTGQERDEENDLYYHGARYFAPWLGRWTACDPLGMDEGPNFFVYGHNSPISVSDPTGMWGWREVAVVAAVAVVATVVTVATAGAAAPLVLAAAEALIGTGALATVATGVAVGAVAGAAGNAAGELTRQVGSGESVSGAKIAGAAMSGAESGALTGGLGAYATTATGGAQLARASTAVAGSSIGRAGAAVSRTLSAGARAVSRVPGVRQVAGALGSGAGAVDKGLGAVERAGSRIGTRAAQSVFQKGVTGGSRIDNLRQLTRWELENVIGGGSSPGRPGISPGQVGSHAELTASELPYDQIEKHHMPQKARDFLSESEGGVIALPAAEHAATRTYGYRGRVVATEEANLLFRPTLARDLRDLRRIGKQFHGSLGHYNKDMQNLVKFYETRHPQLIRK